jgi:hypothetical protein
MLNHRWDILVSRVAQTAIAQVPALTVLTPFELQQWRNAQESVRLAAAREQGSRFSLEIYFTVGSEEVSEGDSGKTTREATIGARI